MSASVSKAAPVNTKVAWFDEVIPAPKKPHKLPVVLSPEEVQQFLGSVGNTKHCTILTTCYAAGLRISEAVRLKPIDIAASAWSSASDFRCASGLAGIGLRDAGQTLTENPTRAGTVTTTKASDGRPQLDRHTLPRKIVETATIRAVPGARNFSATRTGRFLFNVNEQTKPIFDPFDSVQD